MKTNWYRLIYCALFFLLGVSWLVYYVFFTEWQENAYTFTLDLALISLWLSFTIAYVVFLYSKLSIHDYLYMIGLGEPISKKDIEKEYRNEMNCKLDIQLSKISCCGGIDNISTTFYSKTFAITYRIAKYLAIILGCSMAALLLLTASPDSSNLWCGAILIVSLYPYLGFMIAFDIRTVRGSKLSYKAYLLDLKITKRILERKVDRTNKRIIVNNIKLASFYHSLISLLEKETKDIESILEKRDFSMYHIPYGKYENYVFEEFKDEIKAFTKCFVGYIFYKEKTWGKWTKFIYDAEWKGYDLFRYMNKDKGMIFI